MAIEKKTKGTGITAADTISYSGADAAEMVPVAFNRWSELVASHENLFAASVSKLVEHSRWILEGDGPSGPDSAKHFAHRILDLYDAAMGCLREGDGENASRISFDIGFLYSQALMKTKWEKYALSGQKRADALKAAAHRKNSKEARTASARLAQCQKAADEIWKTKPQLSKRSVAQLLCSRFNLPINFETLADRLKKPPISG